MDSSDTEDDGEDGLWFVCLVCNRAFQEFLQLRKHKKKVHGKQGPENEGYGKNKVGFGLILSKENLLPKIQLHRCTGYPSPSTSSLPRDTGRLVQWEKESPTGLPRNMAVGQAKTSVMQPVIKLAKVQVKVKSSHYENRSLSSSAAEHSPKSKKQESPKYFSSIVVNPASSVIKTETTEPGAVKSETDLTALELFIQRDNILKEQIARPDETNFQPCHGTDGTENAMSDDDDGQEFATDLDICHTLDSPEYVDFDPICGLSPEVAVEIEVEAYNIITHVSDVNSASARSPEQPGAEADSQAEVQVAYLPSTSGAESTTSVRFASSRYTGEHSVQDQDDTKVELIHFESVGQVQDVDQTRGNCGSETDWPPAPAVNYSDKKGNKGRPFKCGWPGCGKTYTRKCHLQEHKRKIHKVLLRISARTLKCATGNKAVLVSKVEDEVVADYFDVEKKDVKLLPNASTRKEITDDDNIDKDAVGKLIRESKLRARASMSKSVYVESESEAEQTGSADDTDMEFQADSSPSSEDEVSEDDFDGKEAETIAHDDIGQEAETIADEDIEEVAKASKQIVLKRKDGSEEMYLECAICYCRYLERAKINVPKHIKRMHSKVQVDKALGIVREAKEVQENSGNSYIETVNWNSIRSCKLCHRVLSNVLQMNRHIIEIHLCSNNQRKSTSVISVPESEDGVITDTSNKRLIKDRARNSSLEDDDFDEQEVETIAEGDIAKLSEASKQILLQLEDGGQEMYLECVICQCRYQTALRLNKHIKDIHSKVEVNKALGLLRTTNLTYKGCNNYMETTSANTLRTCNTCGTIFGLVTDLNVHIREIHLKKKTTKKRTKRVQQIQNGEDERALELADASDKILLKVNKERKIFLECKICYCRFQHGLFFQKHIKTIHSKEEIEQALSRCHMADGKDGNDDSSAKQLIEVTDAEELRRCKFCAVVATTVMNMNNHIIRIHMKTLKEGLLKCSICYKAFERKSHLEIHELTHSSSSKFICNTCGKEFLCEKYLKSHVIRMHDIYTGSVPVFKCEVCERPCPSPSYLKQHMQSHSDATHLCTICGKTCRSKQSYRNHMRQHSEERPYKCKHCPATFKLANFLRGHEQRAHERRTKDCKHCGMKFRKAGHRSLHIKKVHHGVVFKCDVCEKVLPNPKSVRRHKLRYHDPNFKPSLKCDICNKVFAFPQNLYNHKRGHKGQVEKKFECKECGKKFGLLCHLKQHSISHIKNEVEKRFECGQCGKKFGLPHHLRQHKATHGIGDYGVKWSRNRGTKRKGKEALDDSAEASVSEEEM